MPMKKPSKKPGARQEITERKQVESVLRESEEHFRSLFENMLNGFAYCKVHFKENQPQDFTYLDVNHAFETLTGLKQVVGKRVSEVIPGIRESDPSLFETYGRVALTGIPERLETFVAALGMWFSVAVYSPKKEYFVAVFDVITERKRAEVELRRTNRALRTISECNQIIVRAAEESQLLEEICGVLVRDGGYRMAWVGYGEHDEGKSVRPMAHAGFDEGYLQTASITWADTERGRGPTGTAIRTGKLVVARNIPTDPSLALWREDALRRGYASSIALPITLNDSVLGALTMYAEVPDAFDSTEMQLLTELTDDLAYGIQALRTRAERKRAEDKLIEERRLLHTIMDNVPDMIYFKDRESHFTRLNVKLAAGLNLTDPAQAVGKTDFDFFPADQAQIFYADEQEIIRTGQPLVGEEEKIVWASGEVTWVSTTKMPQRDPKGKIIGTFGVSRDITERKRTEEALIEEKHLLDTLMDYLPDLIYFKDREGHFTQVNRALARQYGLSGPSQAVGTTDFDFFSPENAQGFYRDEEQMIRTGQPMVGKEEKNIWRDGHVTWDSTTKLPWRDAKGNIIGTFGMSRDITERKRAEEELYESRQMLQTILDTIPQRVFWKDRNFSFLGCNKAFALDAGLKDPAEIIGRNDYELAWRDTAERYRADDKLVMEQETPRLNYEEPQDRPDGSQWWVRTNKLPLRDREGKVVGMIGTFEDITERKQVEAEHVRLVTAIEQSAEGVVITSATGDIEYVNPAFTRITGYSREEVLGKNPRILKSGQQDPAFYQQLWATILRGEIWHGQLINRRKDGSLYTEELNIAPVRGAQGEVTHFISTKQDVTERKQLERQLIQAQKMEAVGRLAGGVAHDFNNLLTIINGYAQLLTERSSPEDPRLELMEEILMAGEKAASLTRQLLAFSRRQVLEPRILDLSRVLADLEKMLHRLIGEDVELVTTYEPDLGRVKVDPGQIEQVVMNLAVNARDAMPEGGKLNIETSNVEIDEGYARSHPNITPGKYVMMAVSDTGCGMDLDIQRHIFEPFFTTKEKGHGTGLGLATTYGIIKQSGGFIWVYSEPGQGSTFKIYFPSVGEALPPYEPIDVPTEPTKGSETVLVVEDEMRVRSMVCETLKSKGYKILEAEGAAQALKIAEYYTSPIHLLLTDVVMPKTSGKGLAKRLSTLHHETRVLYMSGYTDDAIVRQGILEDGASFLQKPFAIYALVRKVRQVLDMKMDPQQ